MTKPDKAIAPSREQSAPAADRLVVNAHASGPLVINLCSSNTPMALVRPDAPELARFTFFVSRRREEGRERFRLHMGYFETRAEAEQLLAVVREVYPAAWVGDAPGQNLRPEARSALAAPGRAAAASPAPPAAAAPAETPAAAPSPPAARAAAPKPAPKPAVAAPAPIAASKPAAAAAAAPAAPQRPAAGAQPPALAPAPPLVSLRATPAQSRPAPAKPATLQQSNVREVLAQLDGAAAPREATTRAVPPRPAAKAPAAPPAMPARPSVPLPTREELEYELVHGGAEATDSQVLRVLENRIAPETSTPSARRIDALPREARDIPVERPQDTMTWREIRQEIAREANVSFALQLVWSPSPIDAATVPPLAIFDAYTLYNVEVSRPNAKQYGLRLGFFSDAMSAKQVAAYVRSEFLSVAVVPVTLSERDQAQKSGGIQLARSVATPGNSLQAEEITLIDELTPPRPRTPPAPAAMPAAASPKPAAAAAAPAKPAAPKAVAAKPARPSRPRGGGPRTLEETLEILGASQLSIDNGKGERLNIGSRNRATSDKRTSTFTKLLDRLSTKLRP